MMGYLKAILVGLLPCLASGAVIRGMSEPAPPPENLSAILDAPVVESHAQKAPPKTAPVAPKIPTLPQQTYEPAYGAYLGVTVDAQAANGSPQVLAGLMRTWNTESGKKHALQMGFVQFPGEDGTFPGWESDPRGWLAPQTFAQAANDNGAAPILTLEPFGNPFQFADDWQPGSKAYEATKSFAIGAGKWGKPLFIRWAHEMNGSWYPWAEWADKNKNLERDPDENTGFTAAKYRTAYRNVAKMFRQYAPNAALIWCPNTGLLGGARRDVFTPFYPGDDVVDWVGLDAYERGFTMPMPGAHLWGGQFAHNITNDMNDDPKTPKDESINFYQTFAVQKRKPMMICETSATLSYRSDLSKLQRSLINNEWKSGYWNDAEYGWMQGVYGTKAYAARSGRKLLKPLDRDFPQIKAIVWFQLAKPEWIPLKKTVGDKQIIVWFDNAYTDYRIGGGIAPDGDQLFGPQEIDLYRELVNTPYFLSKVPEIKR